MEKDVWVSPDPVPLADGSRVRLYKDGLALEAALRVIRDAKHLIGLEVYIFHNDKTGREFAQALSEKARQGVKVFLIYDSFGSWETPRSLFASMRSAGVHIREFHPMLPWNCHGAWRPANRDHRKLLVVDDHIAGLGGLNVGDEYAGAGDHLRWRDNAVGIIGPSTRPLFQAFAHTWHYCQRGGRIRQAEFVHHVHPPEGELGLLASVPTLQSPLRPFLCHVMREARRSIDLTMAYFAPDDDLLEQLFRAGRRGVKIRLMLPGRGNHPMLQITAQSFYELLMDVGAEIFEWQGEMLHAKSMSLDGELTIIGSTNLDHRSTEYNLELSAVIHSRSFGEQMTSLFEHDIRQAKAVKPSDWRHRPAWDRFVHWAVSRARYWL